MSKNGVDDLLVINPEGPIESCEEDALDRSDFVRRLSNALIDRNKGVASGVVIGLTGAWGSGKTSLLNLLEEEVKKNYKLSVVVRFNPWLVSGTNDLVIQFFAELLGTINEDHEVTKNLINYDLTKLLASYGAYLSPLADSIMPGLGVLSGAAVNSLKKAISRDSSLQNLRKKICRELSYLGIPVIVLIDELDRVEDDEIRRVAQLIKAVADFPNISYLVAYDAERVMSALGSGTIEQGRQYLEKIVQYPIPLPVLFNEELITLLEFELAKLDESIPVPTDWRGDSLYRELIGIMIPDVISTPRDVKRLIGTFHVFEAMVRGEVNWVDLLGYCCLVTKAPRTVDVIKKDPDLVVNDGFSQKAMYRRMYSEEQTKEERISEINPNNEGGEGISSLLVFLFPVLSERYGNDVELEGCIRQRRALITVLRLGLPPGQVSRKEIEIFLSADKAGRLEILERHMSADTTEAFIDRFSSIYLSSDVGSVDDENLWIDLVGFLHKDKNWILDVDVRIYIAYEIQRIFLKSIIRKNWSSDFVIALINALMAGGDLDVVPFVLRSLFTTHGLYGYRHEEGHGITSISKQDVKKIAERLGFNYRDMHFQGDLLKSVWSPLPFFILNETGIWDDSCKKELNKILTEDSALQTFMLLLFHDNHVIESSQLSKFVDLEFLSKRLDEVKDIDKITTYSRKAIISAIEHIPVLY
jgi:energy-coupling factor transporter ATP-binding protein EcfA2